jgi:DeoR/GlpR family transcriptional regulator of sugar metabolism
VLLADSSKYGAWSLFNVAHLNTLTDIVTDNRLDDDIQQQLGQLDTRLTLAP